MSPGELVNVWLNTLPLLLLLSAVHTCHMTNWQPNTEQQCCRYNNSRVKHCWMMSCIPMLLFATMIQLQSVSHSISLYLSPACLFLFTLLLYIMWMELVDVKLYVLQARGEMCPNTQVSVLYGLSFMVAAAGVPLELISGLIFMLVGHALHASKWTWHEGCVARKVWPLNGSQFWHQSTLAGFK